MKYIRVKFSDGYVYGVSAWNIACDRAKHYAEREANGGRSYADVFAEELKLAMTDDDVLLDWASNNTTWASVQDGAFAIGYDEPEIDPEAEWTNNLKVVVNGEFPVKKD